MKWLCATALTAAILLTGCSAERISGSEHTEISSARNDKYVTVSDGAKFYDYIYTKDISGSEIPAHLADKAVETAKSNENAKSAEYNCSFSADYDNNGSTEHFIIVDIKSEGNTKNVLIFSDSDENMTVIDTFTDLKPVNLLDFGDFKQIMVGGNGSFEADNRYVIFGVCNNKPVKLRTSYGFAKSNCFLVSYSQTRAMELMYYDTAAKEYRVIPRVETSKHTISAMSSDPDIAEKLEAAEKVYIIGGYYYIFEYEQLYKSDNYDVFVYENGAFTVPAEPVAMSCYDEFSPNVRDFDIKAALDSMIKVGT